MELKEEMINRYKDVLVARPYNRFKPEETIWWLVPTTDWPAYHLPKIIISKEKDEYCLGLYVEKGHGYVVATVDESKKIKSSIMDKSWFWDKFCEEIKKEDSKLNKMLEKMIDYKIYVNIELSYVNYNREESMKEGLPLSDFKAGEIKFLINKEDIELISKKPNPENQDITKLIEVLFECKNLTEVVNQINNFDQIEWTWCDFSIWTELESTVSDQEILNVEKNVLDPIAEYIQTV